MAESPSAVILESPKIKSDTGFHCFPIYFPWSDGTRCHDLRFLHVRSTLNTHKKEWCWSWSSSILVIWCKQTTHWKISWFWEDPRAEEEEGFRGWNGLMASSMQWTWTWATLGAGEGQGAWCTAVHGVQKELHMTGQLNSHVSFILKMAFFPHKDPLKIQLDILVTT